MTVTATQKLQIEISKEEQRRIAIHVIRNTAKWVDGNFISNGKLMLREHYATSHSWSEDMEIREATPLDISADLLINHILSAKLP